MCKCPVSFSHTMGIFFLFESSTFLFVGSHNFSRKFFSHAVSASLAGVKDHIFYRDRSFTGRINFSRHLESSIRILYLSTEKGVADILKNQ